MNSFSRGPDSVGDHGERDCRGKSVYFIVVSVLGYMTCNSGCRLRPQLDTESVGNRYISGIPAYIAVGRTEVVRNLR